MRTRRRRRGTNAIPQTDQSEVTPLLSEIGLVVHTGEPDRGREVIRALGGGETYGTSKGLAIFHTVCGDINAAAEWFERGIEEEREPEITHLLQAVLGKPLRVGPHWPKLAALMNLPEAARTLRT